MRALCIPVVITTAAGALMLGDPSASAASVQGATSVVPLGVCVPQIGVTSKSNAWINGYGSLSNCGAGAGTATLEIQRSRYYGWQTMASAIVTGPGYDQHVSYNCGGTGTHDFRTIITDDQTGQFKISNTLKNVTC